MSLNSSGAMVDVSKFEKIGEYRDGAMIWLSQKKEDVVYMIKFGEEIYVGSSHNIRRRFSQYVPALRRGKYEAVKIQNAFDKYKGFDLYAIEFTSFENLRDREEFYLNNLHPGLNTRTFTQTSADYWTIRKQKEKPKNKFRKGIRIKDLANDSNYKGLQTYISMTDYKRLSTFKIYRNKTISELVSEAIDLWLDVQEGEKSVRLVQ